VRRAQEAAAVSVHGHAEAGVGGRRVERGRRAGTTKGVTGVVQQARWLPRRGKAEGAEGGVGGAPGGAHGAGADDVGNLHGRHGRLAGRPVAAWTGPAQPMAAAPPVSMVAGLGY
jgi:hypothetical protein